MLNEIDEKHFEYEERETTLTSDAKTGGPEELQLKGNYWGLEERKNTLGRFNEEIRLILALQPIGCSPLKAQCYRSIDV